MYRFLLKPGWLALHVGAALLAVLFIFLGLWQLERMNERQARNALLAERLGLEPQPLSNLLSEFRTDLPPADPASVAYRTAQVRGRYDASEEVLLRTTENYAGQAGYYLLTPLVLTDGRALLIERGWVPFDDDEPPISGATPPPGEVDLSGTLQLERPPPSGPLAGLAPRDPPGELDITAHIDTARLSEQTPYELLPVYLQLREQTPAQESKLPLPLIPPELTPGPHLGYAIQWFAFTFIGVVGYGFILQRVVKSRAAAPQQPREA